MLVFLRFLAFGIDTALIFVISYCIPNFISFEIVRNLISLVIFVILIIFKDLFFGSQSIGKKILGLDIVSNDGRSLTSIRLLKRNFLSLVDFKDYLADIITDQRSFGDLKCNTKVIKK